MFPCTLWGVALIKFDNAMGGGEPVNKKQCEETIENYIFSPFAVCGSRSFPIARAMGLPYCSEWNRATFWDTVSKTPAAEMLLLFFMMFP